MKVKLAVVCAVLGLVMLLTGGAVRADGVPNTSSLLIPADVTITSVTIEDIDVGGVYFVDFTFADGTGEARGSIYEGQSTTLNFTVPVHDLTFAWEGFQFTSNDNVGDSFGGPYDDNPDSGIAQFAGPNITSAIFGGSNYGGIYLFNYQLDSTNMPEPSSLMLLGMGLTALIGLKRR
jgi:hypothetical protein